MLRQGGVMGSIKSSELLLQIVQDFLSSNENKELSLTKVGENKFLNIDRLLGLVRKNINLLQENDGNEFWDKLIVKLSNYLKSLRGKKYDSGDVFYELETVLYIILCEAVEIGSDDEETLKSLSYLHESIVNKSDVSKEEYRRRSDLVLYRDRYKQDLSLSRKIRLSERQIKDAVGKELSEYEEREKYLRDEMESMKDNIGLLKGDLTFVNSTKAFSIRASNLRSRYNKLLVGLLFIGVLIISLISFLGYFIYDSYVYLSALSWDLSGEGAEVTSDWKPMFWEEVRLLDIKILLISSTAFLVLLYFFRVNFNVFKDVSEKLDEMEFKAVISYYIEGHIRLVKEADGDANETLKRYEEFLFNDKGIKSKEPLPTDAFKEMGEVCEGMLKASRK